MLVNVHVNIKEEFPCSPSIIAILITMTLGFLKLYIEFVCCGEPHILLLKSLAIIC